MKTVFISYKRPDALDSAMRRPGRLDRELEIRAPTVAERKDILNVLLRKIPHRLEAKQVDHLASVTHGFVGADLSLLCAEASLAAAKRVISSSGLNTKFFSFPNSIIRKQIDIWFQSLLPKFVFWPKIQNRLYI